MLGSFAVGKTSLVKRFVEGRFDDKYLSTIGVKISRKSLTIGDITVNMMLWDLAGGDDMLRSNASYMRAATGAFIVCDLTRLETLDAAEEYARHFEEINPGASIVLLANKADLESDRVITDAQLVALVSGLSKSDWLLTSAKDGLHVEDAFGRMAEMVADSG